MQDISTGKTRRMIIAPKFHNSTVNIESIVKVVTRFSCGWKGREPLLFRGKTDSNGLLFLDGRRGRQKSHRQDETRLLFSLLWDKTVRLFPAVLVFVPLIRYGRRRYSYYNTSGVYGHRLGYRYGVHSVVSLQIRDIRYHGTRGILPRSSPRGADSHSTAPDAVDDALNGMLAKKVRAWRRRDASDSGKGIWRWLNEEEDTKHVEYTGVVSLLDLRGGGASDDDGVVDGIRRGEDESTSSSVQEVGVERRCISLWDALGLHDIAEGHQGDEQQIPPQRLWRRAGVQDERLRCC